MAFQNRKEAKYTLQWTIENFSYAWQTTGQHIVSPVFVSPVFDNMSLILQLYPRGVIDEQYIDFFLRRMADDSPMEGIINLKMLALPNNGSYLSVGEQRIYFRRGQAYGLPHFLKREEVENSDRFLNFDKLTLRCQLIFGEGLNCKFVGKSFAKTRLLMEKISFNRFYSSNIEDDRILLRPMSGTNPMLILSLHQTHDRHLIINMLPNYGCNRVKYYTCTLTLNDVTRITPARLCELRIEHWGQLTRRILDVCLSPLNESREDDAEASKDNSFQIDFKLTFTTGELQNESILTTYQF
ncbi:MATH domain-containing protein [Nephila pilipes]|uniref:MATH domain-containing protein n=1 Tax=Nephila pilipes TaxID=299642 RepID=A0A8X6NLS8_NEPPI|nr:MATH domain-containing protein [Nephila pilipes]